MAQGQDFPVAEFAKIFEAAGGNGPAESLGDFRYEWTWSQGERLLVVSQQLQPGIIVVFKLTDELVDGRSGRGY